MDQSCPTKKKKKKCQHLQEYWGRCWRSEKTCCHSINIVLRDLWVKLEKDEKMANCKDIVAKKIFFLKMTTLGSFLGSLARKNWKNFKSEAGLKIPRQRFALIWFSVKVCECNKCEISINTSDNQKIQLKSRSWIKKKPMKKGKKATLWSFGRDYRCENWLKNSLKDSILWATCFSTSEPKEFATSKQANKEKFLCTIIFLKKYLLKSTQKIHHQVTFYLVLLHKTCHQKASKAKVLQTRLSITWMHPYGKSLSRVLQQNLLSYPWVTYHFNFYHHISNKILLVSGTSTSSFI